MVSMQHRNEITVPPDAETDKFAVEIARVWAAGGKQYLVLRPAIFGDPVAWGLMLVDLVRHAANTYESDKKHTLNEILARIKAGFDTEWQTPSDNRGGQTYITNGAGSKTELSNG